MGAQLSLFVAVKLALFRILRDYTSKLTRGWWNRARSFVSDVWQTGRWVVRSVTRFFRAHGVFLLVAFISVAAFPSISVSLT